MRAAAVLIQTIPMPRLPRVLRYARRWRLDSSRLSVLPIRQRLGLLAVLAALVAVAVGGTYALAERHLDQALIRQDSYRHLNDLAGDVRARAAALRNHQEAFLRELRPTHAEAFRTDSQLIDQALDHMGQQVTTEALAMAVTELKEGFTAATASFARVDGLARQLGLSESTGLRGQLADSVKAAEDELKMWPNAGPLLPTMLQMRQAEKNFMLYGTQASLGIHHKYANQFDFELDASALPASTREELRGLVKSYADDMQAFATASLALKAEVEDLRKGFLALQPTLQSVFLTARDGMTDAIAEQEAERARTSRLVAIIGMLAVGLFVAAVLVLSHSVTEPLRRIERAMQRLAAGNHKVVVPGIDRKDEIGDMAKAVAIFKDNAIAMVRLQQEQETVRREAEAQSRERTAALADTFDVAVKSVADGIVGQAQSIKDIAQSMAQRGAGKGTGSLGVAEAAERSRDSVAAAAEATSELTACVASISRQAAASSSVVGEAVRELAGAERRVQGLADLADDIDRVVGLIGDIAARTNMLALNATIEAQRAGPAGKSFAVVAHEVKQLAVQTAEATRDIGNRLTAIQAASGEAVAAIGDIGGAVRRMDEIAAEVAKAAAHQAEVTDKIERCVGAVADDTAIVTRGVVTVTQSAARYCGAAVRVIWAADDLASPAASLRRQVDGFLATVRAS